MMPPRRRSKNGFTLLEPPSLRWRALRLRSWHHLAACVLDHTLDTGQPFANRHLLAGRSGDELGMPGQINDRQHYNHAPAGARPWSICRTARVRLCAMQTRRLQSGVAPAVAYSPTASSGTTLSVGAGVNKPFQKGRPCLESVAALVQIVIHVIDRLDPANCVKDELSYMRWDAQARQIASCRPAQIVRRPMRHRLEVGTGLLRAGRAPPR